ncbi:DTW domain protein [Rubripirellula amarantea]|uniref:tRNA-uridine aminocarboxypropyltransferase n=1 Tax=Rubripirellula amarantea TaxID=2527999 RepID=A0A5C5WY29_9BACT|nr:tRNA-uridine aminocarboxypropyltransferase [Rubripirellula amarantea]TWT54913.1 DTW domain protein [Rubripirellula amarantea]
MSNLLGLPLGMPDWLLFRSRHQPYLFVISSTNLSSEQFDAVDHSRSARVRCYQCYRPRAMCFCDRIPTIDNRTGIIILQHMRERFHAFNTARIVRKALTNSTLLVDHNLPLADRLAKLSLADDVGVLYPGPEGRLLTDLPRAEHPKQLVVIDGTWHHAKTLLRDIPQLNELPRFRIEPTEPGNYRIRREPNDTALSTLEATVAALRSLEPDTEGLDELVAAFDAMVQAQLDHPKARDGWRENKRRSHNTMGIPRAILADLSNIVVAYGESEPGITKEGKVGCKRSPRGRDRRHPVVWLAERLNTGERFQAVIKPRMELPSDFLDHVELPLSTWNGSMSTSQFVESWSAFLRPQDTLVTFHASTRRLLRNAGALVPESVILKSVKYDPTHQHATLESFLQSQQVSVEPPSHPGRPGRRLSSAIALTRFLNQRGSSAADMTS